MQEFCQEVALAVRCRTGSSEMAMLVQRELFGVRCRTGSSESSDSLNLKTTSTENFPLNSDTYRLFKSF